MFQFKINETVLAKAKIDSRRIIGDDVTYLIGGIWYSEGDILPIVKTGDTVKPVKKTVITATPRSAAKHKNFMTSGDIS